MKRAALFAAMVLAGFSMSREASAQVLAAGTPTDAVSPYLNLLQSTNQFGVNTAYQTILKPLADNRRTGAANTAGIQRLQSQLNSGGASRRRASNFSGHYMNYSHFYTDLK